MKGRLFWRSFFNQALINYRGMTHIGILWALLPQWKEQPEGRQEKLGRSFGFFNSHPYLAGYIIGASARMEQDHEGQVLERLKKAAIPPLGAVGDRLFWYYLRPLSGVLSCWGLVLGLAGYRRLGLSLVIVAWLGYNAMHLWIRWRGISRGMELGREVHRDIMALKQHPVNRWTARAFALSAGLFLGVGFAHALQLGLDGPRLAGLGLVTLVSWQLPERHWALPVYILVLAVLATALF